MQRQWLRLLVLPEIVSTHISLATFKSQFPWILVSFMKEKSAISTLALIHIFNSSKTEHVLSIGIYSFVICRFKNHFFLLGLFHGETAYRSVSTEGLCNPAAWVQSQPSPLFSYDTEEARILLNLHLFSCKITIHTYKALICTYYDSYHVRTLYIKNISLL